MIEQRTLTVWRLRHLLDEVRKLLDQGVPANSNALGAHGYRRVVEYLRGERDLESAIEQTRLDVRHYAKRQLTWFRNQLGDWPWIEPEQAETVVEKTLATAQ